MELAVRGGTQRSRSRGLSFIEVLISMAIMSMSLLSLIPLFILSVKVNAASNQLSGANTLAREKLEQLRGYPSTDPRLSIPSGASLADPSNCASCRNDLPTWQKPATGETSSQAAFPGAGWFPYPCTRSYSIRAFASADLSAPIVSTLTDESVLNLSGATVPYYDVKLVTVTVSPLAGPLPGLRTTRQSTFVRFRSANP